MNDDLRASLDGLVQRTAAEQQDRLRHGTGLSAPDIARRAGRARRRRTAGTAAATLVMVAGLAVAGTAFAGRHDPQPAQTPTPSVTRAPAPSPSPSAASSPEPTAPADSVVLPALDPSLPFGVCGASADAAPTKPAADDFTITLRADTAEVEAGTWLPLVATVTPDEPPALGAVPTAGPQIAVVADGVVIGTANLGPAPGAQWAEFGTGNSTWVHAGQLSLDVCAAPGQPDVTAGRPLPEGVYQIVPWAQTAELPTSARLTDPVDAVVASDGSLVTVRGAGITVTVTGTAETTAPRPGTELPSGRRDAAAAPVCGGPAPVPGGTGGLRLSTDVAGARVDEPRLNEAHAGLTYSGPEAVIGWPSEPVELWAARDGVVVGTSSLPGDGGFALSLAAGPTVPLSFGDLPSQCGPSGYPEGPLPPGEYEVYPVVSVQVDSYITSGGSSVAGDGRTAIVGQPFTLLVG